MTTGERIKEARRDAGLTQSQLAEKLKIPYQSIGQWERNVRKPKKDTLMKIASALECDPYWLMFGEDISIYDKATMDVMRVFCTDDYHIQKASKLAAIYTDRIHEADGYSFSNKEKQLISYFSLLNEKGQKAAIEHAEQLAETPQYQRPEEPDEDKK